MSLLESGKEMVEREVIATQTKNTVIINDGSNTCTIPGYPYGFEAKGDRIMVSVDIFKSGYECKSCKGTGKLEVKCECENTDRPGYKYDSEGVNIEPLRRVNTKCPSCAGDYLSKRQSLECPDCKGKGATLWIPDQSKILPTTGVIVSMGTKVDKDLDLKLHDRVLFSAYVGQMVPTRAPGVAFKIIRDIEVLCKITGGGDLSSFDFVTIDKEM